jgi:hypothetical protein
VHFGSNEHSRLQSHGNDSVYVRQTAFGPRVVTAWISSRYSAEMTAARIALTFD